MSDQKQPVIICRDIHKFFGSGANRFEALRGVSLQIYQKELRMLMGPSGSGKTTLISIIAGILTQDAGQCLINGIDLNHLSDKEKVRYRGKNFGMAFQLFNLIPTLSNEENVAVPLLIQQVPRKEALEKAKAIMQDLGIGDKIGSSPTDLSGGQQQRVAIARALVHEPQIIICDEPTSFLDFKSGQKFMELLKEIVSKKNVTIIVVTHDPRIVSYADKIDQIDDGRLVTQVASRESV